MKVRYKNSSLILPSRNPREETFNKHKKQNKALKSKKFKSFNRKYAKHTESLWTHRKKVKLQRRRSKLIKKSKDKERC